MEKKVYDCFIAPTLYSSLATYFCVTHVQRCFIVTQTFSKTSTKLIATITDLLIKSETDTHKSVQANGFVICGYAYLINYGVTCSSIRCDASRKIIIILDVTIFENTKDISIFYGSIAFYSQKNNI